MGKEVLLNLPPRKSCSSPGHENHPVYIREKRHIGDNNLLTEQTWCICWWSPQHRHCFFLLFLRAEVSTKWVKCCYLPISTTAHTCTHSRTPCHELVKATGDRAASIQVYQHGLVSGVPLRWHRNSLSEPCLWSSEKPSTIFSYKPLKNRIYFLYSKIWKCMNNLARDLKTDMKWALKLRFGTG